MKKLEICETCKFFNFKLGEWQGLNDLCLLQNENELILSVIKSGKCNYYNKEEFVVIGEEVEDEK